MLSYNANISKAVPLLSPIRISHAFGSCLSKTECKLLGSQSLIVKGSMVVSVKLTIEINKKIVH
jgi:hypothetical protein